MLKTEISKMHNPVLIEDAMKSLNLQNCLVVVDGTLGLGGYSEAILKIAPQQLKMIAFELDENNLGLAKERLAEFGDRVIYFNRNFADLTEALKETEYSEVDGIVLDLGLASTQVDQADKGFSFNKDGPLDMRFSRAQRLTAREVINRYSEKELARIFYEYGEENQSRRIARLICERRAQKPIETTLELAQLVGEALTPALSRRERGKRRINPATKVFQALRIEVNGELNNLLSVLNQSINVLKSGGRIVVVSYHSLEDRIVKNFFRDASREYINLPGDLETRSLIPTLKIITKKPISASAEEIATNPRARSAVLRIAEKI